jgi:cellobiose-specific phosphotransferase system component IIC
MEEIAEWIIMPTVKLTENSPRKWIRVIGFLGFVFTMPCIIIGGIFLAIVMIIETIQEI